MIHKECWNTKRKIDINYSLATLPEISIKTISTIYSTIMMKQLLLSLATIFFLWSTVAYTPTASDQSILNNIDSVIEKMKTNDQARLVSIQQKLPLIISRFASDSREWYILTSILDFMTPETDMAVVVTAHNSSTETILDATPIDGWTYLVTKVVDGDTIHIESGGERYSVRLIWLDTPERWEDWFDEATDELAKLIDQKYVNIQYDASQWTTDRYDRLLLYVFYNDINIANHMIINGLATEYTYRKKYLHSDLYKASEALAKSNEQGIRAPQQSSQITTTPSSCSWHSRIQWSRWWCYYLNSNGNKSYWDRECC